MSVMEILYENPTSKKRPFNVFFNGYDVCDLLMMKVA